MHIFLLSLSLSLSGSIFLFIIFSLKHLPFRLVLPLSFFSAIVTVAVTKLLIQFFFLIFLIKSTALVDGVTDGVDRLV